MARDGATAGKGPWTEVSTGNGETLVVRDFTVGVRSPCGIVCEERVPMYSCELWREISFT